MTNQPAAATAITAKIDQLRAWAKFAWREANTLPRFGLRIAYQSRQYRVWSDLIRQADALEQELCQLLYPTGSPP